MALAQVLNKWAGSTERVLTLLEATCHKIHKDATAHKVPLDTSTAGGAVSMVS